MTAPSAPFAPPPIAVKRPLDVLGIVAVCVAGLLLVPALLVLLVGLLPSMNAIWWLGIVLVPMLGIAGALAIVLGGMGIVVAVRRRGRFVLSAIGVALGLLMLMPVAWVFLGS